MEYDLTKQICSYLDSHMMLPLIEFLKETSQYPEDQINNAKADILDQTGCCDFAINVYEALGRDTSNLKQKKEKLENELDKLSKDCEYITQFIEMKKQYREQKEQQHQQHQQQQQAATASGEEQPTTTPAVAPVAPTITLGQVAEKTTPETLDSLYRLAKLSFEVGKYSASRDYLEVFSLLTPYNKEKKLSASWGILESDILSLNWTSAIGDIKPLQDQIDSNGLPVDQLYQRAWLIHRALFVFFLSGQENKSMFVDLLLDDKYLNAVQTTCPYILRYLAVAIITNKKKLQSNLFQRQLNVLVRVIEQEGYVYSDPILSFISSNYVKFNFEEAQTQLSLCEKIIANDYFLRGALEEFIESSRTCIFETYCNIHENIDIDMLCKSLRIPSESSEKWIVEAIRNARFTAKIDSANNQIKMFSQHNNSYRQVMDKTKQLFNRGIEIVVGINESRTQLKKTGDRNKNRQNNNRTNNTTTPAAGATTTTTATATPVTTA
ncbi:hypothetical protein CYY_006166 [Polysphondylium violaceum]|uniref:Eukaryotic translation initiation factor 3 subunit E n=1 Tax=Polysphondylium violaceum TaxID=133409 RepID=A0A8J4UZ60_9MYCE|nr:hypothetical protein CYY_006166 [Polysphondylium violaceum]